jgi:hypothetical protein
VLGPDPVPAEVIEQVIAEAKKQAKLRKASS